MSETFLKNVKTFTRQFFYILSNGWIFLCQLISHYKTILNNSKNKESFESVTVDELQSSMARSKGKFLVDLYETIQWAKTE